MVFDEIYDINNIPQIEIQFDEVDVFFTKYKLDILKNAVKAIDYIIESPLETNTKVLDVSVKGGDEVVVDMSIYIYAEDIYGSMKKLMQSAIELEEYEIAARIKQIKQKINIE